MFKTGGLDTQVRNRMMQNPMQLQQNYKQKGDILDLIALQMIKSEKDQKKKDLALKMQQTPGTIKQQMEKAVMQQTKDDLVKQTAGILGVKNAQRNKNMQKLLAGAGKRRPPMGGIAQPLQRRTGTAPTMANPLGVMANAGKRGSGIDKVPAQNMQGMTRRAAQGGIVGFAGTDGSYVSPDLTNLEGLNKINFGTISGDEGTDIIDKAATASGTVRSGIESVLTNRDTDKIFDDRLKKAQASFGFTDAQLAEMKKLYQERKDIQAKQFNPDKLRQQGLLNVLGAMAGGTSLASMGSRGVAAGAQTTARQEAARLNQQKAKDDLFRNLLSDVTQNKKDIFKAGETKEGIESGEFKQGLVVGANVTRGDYDLLSNVTKMALDAEIANQDQYTRLAAERIKEQLQLHLNAEDNRVRIQIANLQASTEAKIRKFQSEIEDRRLRDLSKNELIKSYNSDKTNYGKIMSDNNNAVMGFYKNQLAQLQLEKNSEPEGSTERILKEREYNALLELVQESQNLLNQPSIDAIAEADRKLAELSGFSITGKK
jgi:hypothetical protein